MARRIYQFDPPERFVAGTIGEPGERTFFLQARDGERTVSVVLEKVQVAALADRLGVLLVELRDRGVTIPDAEAAPRDAGPLDEPVDAAFRAGVLSLAWDTLTDVIIVEARELREDEDEDLEVDDEDPDGPDLLRVRLTPSAVLEFVRRAHAVVAAGRPPCPWCGEPLEATGHFCTRRNGHRAN